MSKPILVAEVFAGPYVAEIYDHDGWFLRRYEVQIWGDSDFLCHNLRWGVREVLYDLASSEERRLRKIAGQTGSQANYARACSEPFVELCRETAQLLTHLSSGRSLESFPGYRVASDEHHHVYFKDRQQEQNHEINR